MTEAIPELGTLLKNQELQIRISAAEALMRVGAIGADVVAALSDALQSSSLAFRERAIKGLGELGPAASSALPLLRKATTEDAYPGLRALPRRPFQGSKGQSSRAPHRNGIVSRRGVRVTERNGRGSAGRS